VIAEGANLSLSGKLIHSLCSLTSTLTDLVYRGINEGRQAAREVDLYLEHCTSLPVTGGIVKRTAQEIFSAAKLEAHEVAVKA
jgi:hypothetical protein